jgi:hypothetical protein
LGTAQAGQWVSRWQQAALSAWSKGMDPLVRKASANAKRLSRTALTLR